MASVANWCRPTIDTKGYSNVQTYSFTSLPYSQTFSLPLSFPPTLFLSLTWALSSAYPTLFHGVLSLSFSLLHTHKHTISCFLPFFFFSLTHHFLDPLFNKLFFIHFARFCFAKTHWNGLSRRKEPLKQLVFVLTGFCCAFTRCKDFYSDAFASTKFFQLKKFIELLHLR